MRAANPMHVMSLRKPKGERVSLRFLKWILNSARFGWRSNALLIVLYGSYLLFGAHMLIESEQSQVEDEEDLVALSKQSVRNEILLFSLYNGYISNLSHGDPNDLAKPPNDDRISRPNGRTNGRHSSSNPYISRDRELRLRIDKGLNELENEIKRHTSRVKLRANLSRLNETFYFVVRLLTTLGNDQTDLLLTYSAAHSKLFIAIYSLFGIPVTLALAYHHGQLLIYGLSGAIDQLQACCKRVCKKDHKKANKKSGEFQRTKKRPSANGRPKKPRLESSSLTHPNVNQRDSPSARVNSLIQNSNLNSNLQFVLANRSSIMLPNRCVNLNRFSLAEPYSPNENYGGRLCSSISHNELNSQSFPCAAGRHSLEPNSISLIHNSQFTDQDSVINLLGPAWLSQSLVDESASNSLNHLVDTNSMNSSTINLTNHDTFCAQNLVSYNSVNNLISRNEHLDEFTDAGDSAVFGRHSMPNSMVYSSGLQSFGLHSNPHGAQNAAFHSYANLHRQRDFDTKSLPFQAINRTDSHHNLLRSDSYRSGLYSNRDGLQTNNLYQDPSGNSYRDAYQVSYQDPLQVVSYPNSSSYSLRDGLVEASFDARSLNDLTNTLANRKNSKSIRSRQTSNEPADEESKLDRERNIPISLFLAILALYLFMISFLVHRIGKFGRNSWSW